MYSHYLSVSAVLADEYIQAVPALPSVPLCDTSPQTLGFWIPQDSYVEISGSYPSSSSLLSIRDMLNDLTPGLEESYVCIPKIYQSSDDSQRRCFRDGDGDSTGEILKWERNIIIYLHHRCFDMLLFVTHSHRFWTRVIQTQHLWIQIGIVRLPGFSDVNQIDARKVTMTVKPFFRFGTFWDLGFFPYLNVVYQTRVKQNQRNSCNRCILLQPINLLMHAYIMWIAVSPANTKNTMTNNSMYARSRPVFGQ